MSDKVYLLHVMSYSVGNQARALHSEVIEFTDHEEALAAQTQLNETKTRNVVLITKTRAQPTPEEIFMELLKANPLANVEDLWDRSESVFKLMKFKRI